MRTEGKKVMHIGDYVIMTLVLIVSLGWWEQKAESVLATACMNHPSEQFDSERVTGGKTET